MLDGNNIDPGLLAQIRQSPKPHYQLLSDAFIEPHKIFKGSIIMSSAPPGPHLIPLNEAADAAWDKWINLQVPELDEKGVKTGRKVKIREQYAIRPYERAEAEEFSLVAMPGKETFNPLDISMAASKLYGTEVSRDQRPGPDSVYAARPVVVNPPPVTAASDAEHPAPEGAVAGAEGEVQVIASASPLPPSARGKGA